MQHGQNSQYAAAVALLLKKTKKQQVRLEEKKRFALIKAISLIYVPLKHQLLCRQSLLLGTELCC